MGLLKFPEKPKLGYHENLKYYTLECPPKDIPEAKKNGFIFNLYLKKWVTRKPSGAFAYIEHADEDTKTRLLRAKRKLSLSYSIDDAGLDSEIPVPDGLSYLPFQKAGIIAATERGNILIGDEMGLGKTIQAIGTLNNQPKVGSVLVITTLVNVYVWKAEMEKWLVHDYTIGIADGKTYPDTDIVITHYDALPKVKDEVHRNVWDYLIVDEAHNLRNPKNKITQIVLGSWKNKRVNRIESEKVILLTGSSMLNKAEEIFGLIHRLDPDSWGSFTDFEIEYCSDAVDVGKTRPRKIENLDELQDLLRSTVLIRRFKKDVLKDLPEKSRRSVVIEAEGEDLRDTLKSVSDFTYLDALYLRAEIAKVENDLDLYGDLKEKIRKNLGVRFEEVAGLRSKIASEKIPYIVSHLSEIFENSADDYKVVFFAHHKKVLDEVEKAFKDICVRVDGSTAATRRKTAVDEFQESPEIKLFLGSIEAAGVAITLTAASHLVFGELNYVPEILLQAEDRIHRIGQTAPVLIEYLVFKDSYESNMADILINKQEVVNGALGSSNVNPLISPAGGRVSVNLKEYEDTSISDGEKIALEEKVKTLSSDTDETFKSGIINYLKSCTWTDRHYVLAKHI